MEGPDQICLAAFVVKSDPKATQKSTGSAEDAKVLKRLAQAVRRARTSAAMTQEDVAFAAAVSARHYQELESGRLNPSFLMLRAVAAAVGRTVAILTAEADRSHRP
jgi:DNA-binding XRE family transcriptional regulator